MKRYLLDVTFYAGSDTPEDVDHDLFMLCVDKEITKNEMENIFIEVNKLLDCFDDKEKDFPVSYENGLNIWTLIEGVEVYTKGKIERFKDECGAIAIDNYYIIKQWQ